MISVLVYPMGLKPFVGKENKASFPPAMKAKAAVCQIITAVTKKTSNPHISGYIRFLSPCVMIDALVANQKCSVCNTLSYKGIGNV